MQVKSWILRRVFKYLSPVISLFENKKIKKYNKQNTKYSPVFIIGPPRSGSTILYQLITNFFDVSYIDNLMHLSRENLFFGLWLSKLFYKNKSHNTFMSDYGNTQKHGLHAPSEGGNIWYRWFDKSVTYFEKDSLSNKKINSINRIFKAILNKYNKPLIIKNLMFSQRIKALSQIYPNSKFIVIKRSPEFNAQSIYKAKLKMPKNEWWSTKPKNYKKLLNLSLIEQSVSQVYFLEKQIHEDLGLFPKENITSIKYEDLINASEKTLNSLCDFIDADKLKDYSNIKLKSEDAIKIKQEDFNLILDIVNKFDWENYKND